MASLEGIEPIVEKIASMMRDKYPSQLEATRGIIVQDETITSHTDLSLEKPGLYETYEVDNVTLRNKKVIVEILPVEPTAFTPHLDYQYHLRHHIGIMVTCVHGDRKKLVHMVYRYVKSIVDLFADKTDTPPNFTLEGLVGGMEIMFADYSPTGPLEHEGIGEQWQRSGLVIYSILVEEVY